MQSNSQLFRSTLDQPSRVNSQLEQPLQVRLIYMTPLVRNRVVIAKACHFYSSGCIVFNIFVEPHALLA